MTFAHNPVLSICWAVMILCEWYLAVLCLRTIRNRYPAFTAYSCFIALKSLALIYVSNQLGHVAYFYAYYYSAALADALEIAAIVEVFAKLFRPYRFVPVRLLGALAIAVPTTIIALTEVNMLVWHKAEYPILGVCRVLERTASWSIFTLMISLVCFSSYFSMQWRSRLAGISIGLFVDAISGLITATLVTSADRARTELIAFIPVLCFTVSLLIWIRYIRRPEDLAVIVGRSEMAQIRELHRQFVMCLEELPHANEQANPKLSREK